MKEDLYLKGKMAFLTILSMAVLSNCTSSQSIIKEERISPSELRDHLSDTGDMNNSSTSETKIRLLELRANKRGFEVVPEYNYAGKELDNRVYKTVGVTFRDDTGKRHKKEFIQTLSKRWPQVRFVDTALVRPGDPSTLLFEVLIEPHSTSRSGIISSRTTASLRDVETKILLGRLNQEIFTNPDSLLRAFIHPECPAGLKDSSQKFYLKKRKCAGGEESFGILAVNRNDSILLGMTKSYHYINGVMGMLGKRSDSDTLRLADSNEKVEAIEKETHSAGRFSRNYGKEAGANLCFERILGMKKSKTGLEVDPERNLLDASLSGRKYSKICLVTKGDWKQGDPALMLNHARKVVRSEWPFLRQVKETAIDKDTLVLSISRREGKVIDDWFMDNGSFSKEASLCRTEYRLSDGKKSFEPSWARAYYMEEASRLSEDEQEAPCLVKLLRMITGETDNPNLFQETQTWTLKTDWSRYFLLYSRSEWKTEKKQVYVQ